MAHHYARPHDLDALHDELLAAGLAPVEVAGRGDDIWLAFPAGAEADEARAAEIVAAHDPLRRKRERATKEAQRDADLATVRLAAQADPTTAALLRLLGFAED